MQVERQPSPWPGVAVLIGLLLFCLTVPRYWRNESTPGDYPLVVPPERATDAARVAGLDAASLRFSIPGFSDVSRYLPRDQRPDDELLTLWGPPTIEELIAARMGLPRQLLSHEATSVDWPLFATPAARSPAAPQAETHAAPAVAADPMITAALERVGRAAAECAPAAAVPRLLASVVNVYPRWASARPVMGATSAAIQPAAEVALPAASTLRLLNPNERLAMVVPKLESGAAAAEPVRPQPANQSDLHAPPNPWCVPETLFEQLERLACHPYSARWADNTLVGLQALTSREQLDGSDVPAILAALGEAAQQAVRLADATGEDRLRVELLRAHWGLARRLDCWDAIHVLRVAERSGQRVAARDSLGSFFDSGSREVERIDGAGLSVELEEYERTRDPRLGRQVARERQSLASSSDSLDRALAESVEQHYRNANVRIAVTAAMLNRLAAEERSEVRPVRDRITGTPVRGRSHTQSESRVRLEPASGRWQLDVEARGIVISDTLADGGRARLRSHGTTDFTARKQVVVDPGGVVLQRRTQVDATNHNRLVGVTTDFDWLPLVGAQARERAMQQYRARRARAKAEVEFKVAAQAVEQVDRRMLDAVQRIERQVRRGITDRLAEGGVELTTVEMTTTYQRVVGRFRVAGEHQLGAHTPRPRALSDSLASVQIHETALTNAAVTLGLDGARYTGPELRRVFREKFPEMALDSATAERDVAFYFAPDAVQFHIDKGRLEITLALAALEQDGRLIHDFIVHAYYLPVVRGLEAELVRDGAFGIEGRLSAAERARLHSVFNTVLPADRTLPVVLLDDPNDPRLEGLMITQLVLEDGWLGLAVGPESSERVAERSRSLR